MKTSTAANARVKLNRLIDEVAEGHLPLLIVGKRNSAVLVGDEDWSAIQETLFLMSLPGMRVSIKRGKRTPARKLFGKPRW